MVFTTIAKAIRKAFGRQKPLPCPSPLNVNASNTPTMSSTTSSVVSSSIAPHATAAAGTELSVLAAPCQFTFSPIISYVPGDYHPEGVPVSNNEPCTPVAVSHRYTFGRKLPTRLQALPRPKAFKVVARNAGHKEAVVHQPDSTQSHSLSGGNSSDGISDFYSSFDPIHGNTSASEVHVPSSAAAARAPFFFTSNDPFISESHKDGVYERLKAFRLGSAPPPHSWFLSDDRQELIMQPQRTELGRFQTFVFPSLGPRSQSSFSRHSSMSALSSHQSLACTMSSWSFSFTSSRSPSMTGHSGTDIASVLDHNTSEFVPVDAEAITEEGFSL